MYTNRVVFSTNAHVCMYVTLVQVFCFSIFTHFHLVYQLPITSLITYASFSEVKARNQSQSLAWQKKIYCKKEGESETNNFILYVVIINGKSISKTEEQRKPIFRSCGLVFSCSFSNTFLFYFCLLLIMFLVTYRFDNNNNV